MYLQNEGIVINDEIIKKLKQRYFDDKKENTETLDFLINYLDMGDYIQILQANTNIFIDKKSLKKLCDEIEKLIPTRNRIMHVRPLEFDDDEKVLNFVRNINNFDKLIKFDETKNEFDKINNNPNYLLSIVPNVYHEKKSNHLVSRSPQSPGPWHSPLSTAPGRWPRRSPQWAAGFAAPYPPESPR